MDLPPTSDVPESVEHEKAPALASFLSLQSVEVLEDVLVRDEVDVNEKDHNGRTALWHLHSASFPKTTPGFQLEATKRIVEHDRFDVHAVDVGGRSYIMHLLGTPGFDIRLLDLLLSHGADLEQRDGDGETAIFHAITLQNNWEATIKLVEQRADLYVKNSRGYGLVHRMISNMNDSQDPRYIELILGATPGLVDVQDKRGRTALHQASFLGKVQLAGILLYHDADVNIVDNFGRKAF